MFHRLVLVASLVAGPGALWCQNTPGMALISDRAEHAGIAQGLAFGVMNLGWAMGAAVGPAAGGALAQAVREQTIERDAARFGDV